MGSLFSLSASQEPGEKALQPARGCLQLLVEPVE